MVDIGKKKESDDSGSGSDSRKKDKESKSGGTGGSGSDADVYSPDRTTSDELDEVSIPDVSKKMSAGADATGANEGLEMGERGYLKAQLEESDEFYDDFINEAIDSMVDIDEFSVTFHALCISAARLRITIQKNLEEHYGNSPSDAKEKAERIVKRAGEDEAIEEVLSELSSNMKAD